MRSPLDLLYCSSLIRGCGRSAQNAGRKLSDIQIKRFAHGPQRDPWSLRIKYNTTNPKLNLHSLGNFPLSERRCHQQLWGRPPDSIVDLIHSNRVEDRSNVVTNLLEIGFFVYSLQNVSRLFGEPHKISKLFCEDCSNFFGTSHRH